MKIEKEENLRNLSEELRKCKQLYLKKQENQKRMKENVFVDKNILNDKETDISNIRLKIKSLFQANQLLRNKILSKNEEKDFLHHQLNKLQETVKILTIILVICLGFICIINA